MLLKNFLMKVPACEVKIKKKFLVLNGNGNGTVEMNDVHLILPPPGGTNCTAKT